MMHSIPESLNPSPNLYKECQILQTKYELLSTEEAENLFLRAQHRVQEFGDKITNWSLAYHIGKSQASSLIPQLNLSSGITTTFDLNLNEISPLQTLCEVLEEDIQIKKITDVIASLKTGKAPGPDGFPSDFYKEFSKLLCPLLPSVFSVSLQNSKFPPTLYEATISLILEKDKSPQTVVLIVP